MWLISFLGYNTAVTFVMQHVISIRTYMVNNSLITLNFQTDRSGQSDRGLHCLQFCLHLLDALLYGKATLFKF